MQELVSSGQAVVEPCGASKTVKVDPGARLLPARGSRGSVVPLRVCALIEKHPNFVLSDSGSHLIAFNKSLST